MVTSKVHNVAMTFATIRLRTIITIVPVTTAPLSRQGHASPVSSIAKISPHRAQLPRTELAPGVAPAALARSCR